MGDLGWQLGVLARAYRDLVVGACSALPHGHRGFETLAAVVEGDHPSQLALAAHLGIDRTVMTYLIDDLVAAGLVERQANPADRRQRRVVATPAGVSLFQAQAQLVGQAEEHLLAALSPAEQSLFRSLLGRVSEAVGHACPRDATGAIALPPD